MTSPPVFMVRARFKHLVSLSILAIVALAILSSLVAACVPVYTDELLYKMSQGRLNLDGYANVSAYLTCGTLAFPVPPVLLPFRWLDTALYERVDDPFVLRAVGWLLAALLIGAAVVVVRRLDEPSRRVAVLLVASAVSIGVMPLLLVINRPEQLLLLGVIVFGLPLVLDIRRRPVGWVCDVFIAMAFVLIGSVIMASHPRSILLFPLATMCLLRYVSHRLLAAPAVLLLGVVALATVHNMGLRTGCSDPHLAPILLQDSLLAAIGTGQIGSYLLTLLANALSFPGNVFYLSEFQFKPDYRSYILPGVDSGFATALGQMTEGVFALLLFLGSYAFIVRLRRVIGQGIGQGTGWTQIAALFCLWFFWAFSVVARVYKNDYEASVLAPVIALMTIGSIWAAREDFRRGSSRRWGIAWRGGVLGFAALAIVSQATLITVFAPAAWSDWRVPGYPPGQRFSVSGFGYDTLRPAIVHAGEMCGITPDGGARHLILDELTYYAYRRSYQPFLATFIDPHGWGRDIKDFRAVLANVASQGMVVGCQWVPDSLRKYEKQSGIFCCIPPSAWR